MPSLLEVQRAMYRSLVQHDDEAVAPCIIADGLPPEARLSIYRNTFVSSLTTALRLSFPAVHRLVGTDFFEHATARFIAAQPPQSAYLDDYGGEFAAFLANLPGAATLCYLPGVARLEWAVSCALHAPDLTALEISRLNTVDPADHGRVRFQLHPSVGLVHDDAPVDLIWRAVLDRDDAVIAAIDLCAGPVWLLVERGTSGIEVKRIDPPAWRFAEALLAGNSITAAMTAVPDADAVQLLAEHFAAGRFVEFGLAPGTGDLPELCP